MSDELNLEALREQVVTIQIAIEKYDEITSALADNRWKFEMTKRVPHLNQILPNAQVKQKIEQLRAEQTAAEDVVKLVTGKDSVDEARKAYLDLLATYQRVGALRELERMVLAGFATAITEADKELSAPIKAEGTLTKLGERLALAKDALATAAATITTPAISDIVPVTTGLRLS